MSSVTTKSESGKPASSKRKASEPKKERRVKCKWEREVAQHKKEILKARDKIKELDEEVDHQINKCNHHGHLYRTSRIEAFKETLGEPFCHRVLSGPADLQDKLTKHGIFNEKSMTQMFQKPHGQGVPKQKFAAADLKGDKTCSLCCVPHPDCKEWGTLVLWAEPVPHKYKRVLRQGNKKKTTEHIGQTAWQWKASYLTTEMPNLQVTELHITIGTQVPKACAIKYVWLIRQRFPTIDCDASLSAGVEEQEKAFADPLDEYKSSSDDDDEEEDASKHAEDDD